MQSKLLPPRWGLALAAVILATAPAQAQWGPPPARTSAKVLEAYREVVKAPSQSTVRILCDNKEVALGTIVEADGYIVTKASQLKGKIVCKFKDGRSLEATIVGVEDKHDLAMLKVRASGLKPIVWAHSKTAEAGNLLAAPGIGDVPVSVGVVSVPTRKPSPREMSMMAPNPNAGFMGVVFAEADSGVVIGQVVPNGPAAKGGVKRGDRILRVAGKPMRDPERVIETVYAYKPGDTITLRIQRDEDEMTLRVVLGRRPRDLFDRSDEMNRMGSALSGRRGGFPTILQHDMVIKPTDCGGPLVDLDGKAVGINIARAGRTESYAIPSEEVRKLLSDLKSEKLKPAVVINDDKILDLETEIKIATTGLRKAQDELAEEEDADAKRKLRARIDLLRKKINTAQDALSKLKGDPTKVMK